MNRLSQHINLLVRNRQEVIYQGEAVSLTTKNEDGVFDILPQHTQFISIITEVLTIGKPDGTTLKLPIDTGILKVVDNDIKIYLGIFSATKQSPAIS